MEKQKRSTSQKRKSVIVTSLLALAMIVTGTFAWTSFSQIARNEAEFEKEPGGRVHDDYYVQNVLDGTTNIANKDVYAENYGSQDIYVRIRLSEYLEIDHKPVIGGDRADRTTWVPNNSGVNAANKYVEWDLEGESKTYLPTFNQDNKDFKTDASGDAIDIVTGGQTVEEGDGTHNCFTVGQTVTGDRMYRDADGNKQTETGWTSKAQDTLTQAKPPMTMEQWKKLPNNDKIGAFWVMDTDGWAYWAEKLAPDTATSLLLDEIEFLKTDYGQMYYAIDVEGQFANQKDVFDFWLKSPNTATDDAKDLINTIGGTGDEGEDPAPTITYKLTVNPASKELELNSTQKFTSVITKYENGVEVDTVTDPAIEYEIVEATIKSSMTGNTLTVGADETLTNLTIKVTSPKYNVSATSSITVNIPKPSPFEGKKPGDFITDPETGVTWRVLDELDGNLLIITEHVYGYGTKYNTTNKYTLYESSNLKTEMDAWYKSSRNVGKTIRGMSLEYKYPSGSKGNKGDGIEYDWSGTFSWNASANLDRALTEYGDPITSSSTPVFPLSVSEANAYKANNANNKATDTAGTARLWWLRSPGDTATNCASRVGAVGTVLYSTATYTTYGFRPALWINPN